MKTFSELEHMRLYRQPLMVPFEEKNKKKGTVVHLLTTETMTAADIIKDENIKNPRLIEGYYIDKGIAHLISEDETAVGENAVLEIGIGTGVAAGYISKLAVDAALKYSEKYINAKEAKTPTQKQTASVVFMSEYKRGKKAFQKFKNSGNKPLRNTTPDAWWLDWFGVTASDIKAIGKNERNKVSKTKFENMLTEARRNTKIVDKITNEFQIFLENKDFYLISSAIEDNGKVIPFKVEYFYCPQVDKIFSCSSLNVPFKLDFKHPISISDYLNRSKKSMLEIKDVLKICEEKDKSGE